jgi:predicted MFS family arabinose efflux permease
LDRVRAPVRTVTGESGHGVRMLFLVFAGWAIIQTVQNVIPPVLPLVIEDLQLSPVVAGASLTAMNGLYALGQFPSGQIADRINRITPVAISLVGLVVGATLIAGATTGVLFVVGICAFGLAKAFYVIPSRALVSDLFEASRGRAVGVVTVGSDFGGVAAAGVAFLAIGAGNWRLPFLPLAGLLIAALGVFLLWSRNDVRFARPSVSVVAPLRRVSRDPELRRLVAAYSLFWFAGLSVLNFLPTFLGATKTVTLGIATWLFALLFVTGAIVKPIGGMLSDRVPRIWVSAGSLGLAVLALLLIVIADKVPVIALGVVVFAVGWKIQPPVVEALLMDRSADAHVGADLGVAKALSFGLGSFGPTYVGYMGETYGYDLGFVGLIVCLLGSAALLVSLRQTRA